MPSSIPAAHETAHPTESTHASSAQTNGSPLHPPSEKSHADTPPTTTPVGSHAPSPPPLPILPTHCNPSPTIPTRTLHISAFQQLPPPPSTEKTAICRHQAVGLFPCIRLNHTSQPSTPPRRPPQATVHNRSLRSPSPHWHLAETRNHHRHPPGEQRHNHSATTRQTLSAEFTPTGKNYIQFQFEFDRTPLPHPTDLPRISRYSTQYQETHAYHTSLNLIAL